MKKIYYSFILIFFAGFLSSCNSSKKLLERGQYNLAVQKAVNKLQHDRDNEKQIDVLMKAYPLANQENIDRINFLNREGRDDRWEEIYRNYAAIMKREKLIRTVTPLKYHGRLVEFDLPDYTDEMIEAKKNAADYYYNRGLVYMKQNHKSDFRRAYENFLRVKQLNPSEYIDLENLIREAYEKGITHVAVTVENRSRFRLDQDFLSQLISLNYNQINTKWKKYSMQMNGTSSSNFDYTAKVVLSRIDISPEHEETKTFMQSKRVADGFEYEYDSRGNVKKDSLGNDIKRIKYKTIKAEVYRTSQSKSITVYALVKIYMNGTRKLVQTYTFTASDEFENTFYKYKGDKDAISDELKKKLGGDREDFPSDRAMLNSVVPDIKLSVAAKLKASRQIIK